MNKKPFLVKFFILLLLILTVAIGFYIIDDEKETQQEQQPKLAVSQILGGNAEGYTQALKPRIFKFPDDHGAHPDFRNEWWYFTGNLKTPTGRHFGYQFTLFRNALSPQPNSTSSNWSTNQMMMGHFAVTDVQSGQFYHFERFSRIALELAGAEVEPFHIWLENWSAKSMGVSLFPLKIYASENGMSLELELTASKNLTLQGNQGLSQKGHSPGNASYYYSFTRLKTKGHLQIEDQQYTLQGASWMDREWSTSSLEEQQVGWDWFSLQLSNGWDLMFYQLRLKNGQADTTSSGVLVSPAGDSFPLSHAEVSIQVLDYWTSPTTKIRYPAQWKLTLPKHQIALMVTPYLAQQELNTSFTYWEGAVKIDGTFKDDLVQGSGYIELTGYQNQ